MRASGGLSEIVGPLEGYHHETYVFALPEGVGEGRWKCRAPRAELLWFDRRCFHSEEELLVALSGRVARIPEVLQRETFRLQRFVEGQTLGQRCGIGTAVPAALVDQIIALFRDIVRVAPESLAVERRCAAEDRPQDGDTDGFVERLVHFTEQRVFLENESRFGGLFKEFGIGRDAFRVLRERVSGLRPRPFCLLHGDLHRENFIVDPAGLLWTIDWELAMVGDPLYDLATHLHLMRYTPDQAREVRRRWCEAVEAVRPGSSAGWRADLPKILDYKRAQSVFTDVIRGARLLGSGAPPEPAAERVRAALEAARPALGLGPAPSREDVADALRRWA
ncbi:phosphotransferase [Streptomyces sp. G45]|uniref:phosphotransferase n=1 Tax=Streptomyces sp. G45 TaxID=3406627 RepID=UPI003C1628F7